MNRLLAALLVLSLVAVAPAAEPGLRLVPYPKEMKLAEGRFEFAPGLVLAATDGTALFLSQLLNDELRRGGLGEIQPAEIAGSAHGFRLSKPGGELPPLELRPQATDEEYVLRVEPTAVICVAKGPAGVFYGLQTLCQLVRANRSERTIPCLAIHDWPSLRWRCFQDDMTRGPSSKLETLQFEAALASYLKLNMMTYYMEHQFAFKKHPKIGPPNGSLTPDDLSALVRYARPLHVEVLGNQQSFGHFGHILKHPEYAGLRETPDVLSPVKEETYQLLDDMYGEVCPLLPCPMFNVCCDETWGLGTGPSKELAGKIGVGGVYVRHIRRVHDLLVKHKKRMMMWGDIILEHPNNLNEIPKDTIMLTWAYDPRASFETQIVPFARSGYEFFVCPGVSNWSRILPDFNVARVNIRNFVRDGVKHGALGMINTDWEDDGEAINAVKWYCDAWAAECAWNGSTTPLADFDRRVGAVLFGERGDRFGQAIDLLAKTHTLPGMRGMNNSRFWEDDFIPKQNPAAVEAAAGRLLDLVRPAIDHLEAVRKEAVANRAVVDAYLLGARRMEWIGRRMLGGLSAARLYTKTWEDNSDREKTAAALEQIEAHVRMYRDATVGLGKVFSATWLSESKPHALDAVMARYAAAVKRYDDLLARLRAARQALPKRLPRPEEIGLALPEAFARRARPQAVQEAPLAGPWAVPGANHRFGLTIRIGNVHRSELPVEVELALPADLAKLPVRALATVAGREPAEVLAQIDAEGNKHRLIVVLPGPLPAKSEATVHVYLGAAGPRFPTAVSTSDAPRGMKWIENDKIRVLLGGEGAHLYRWEVKGLNRDLTEPGETGWAGFFDINAYRATPYQLKCVAAGPALVRYQCIDPERRTKNISVYGGASWAEAIYDDPTENLWNFDATDNFAADGPTPGQYRFSNGTNGPVGKRAEGVAAQVEGPGSFWSVKFHGRLALGLATPGVAAMHHIAPGSGAGGVGIEHSPPTNHFVTFGGTTDDPAGQMERLAQTLDLRNPPDVVLYSLEPRR